VTDDHLTIAEDTADWPAEPPLVTSSWLRAHAKTLDRLQLDGETCIYCAREPRIMVPVGKAGMRRVFACYPACRASHGQDRP
jgi:hypothetical protein